VNLIRLRFGGALFFCKKPLTVLTSKCTLRYRKEVTKMTKLYIVKLDTEEIVICAASTREAKGIVKQWYPEAKVLSIEAR
jgi:hypothetical protein